MKQNRNAWLDLVLEVEGEFSDHPKDKGGPTFRGVTLETLAAWRRQPVTVEDLKALTDDEIAGLYSARYWNVVKGDQLPPGLDVLVADIAVLCGTRRAAEMLQEAVRVEIDGHIGPVTIEAARRAKLDDLISAVHERRMAFLRSLPTWPTFGRGWTNRCLQVVSIATDLADQQPAPAPAAVAVSRINTQTVAATVGIIVAAAPAMRDAYEQTASATTGLSGLAPWLPVAFGAVAAACVLLLSLRGKSAVKDG
jgi:lysozyme family protein